MNKLKRVLRLPMLTFYGIGMILGAGIYTVIGKAAGIAGPSVWMSFILASLTTVLAALSYAECASMFPKAGGEYVYLRKAFPQLSWVANSGGLLMTVAGITTASAVALSFAGYFQDFFPLSTMLISLFALIFFTLVNIWGIKESSWMNVTFTLIEIVGLLIFIYYGMTSSKFSDAVFAQPSLNTISASSLVIFAFFGFENLVNFVEETKEPKKTLPRAILLSLIISTFLYVLVALSVVSLLSIDELQKSRAPLADALRLISPKAALILASIALFSTANTILISTIATSRIVYGMAREKALPKILSKLQSKRKTPWIAAAIVGFFASVLLITNNVELLANISSFITILAFIAVHITLITLRINQPELKRVFRIPLSYKEIPLIPLFGILISIGLLFQFKTEVYIISGVLIALIIISQLLKKQKS